MTSAYVNDDLEYGLPEWGESRIAFDEDGVTVEVRIGKLFGGTLGEASGRGPQGWSASVVVQAGVTWRVYDPEGDYVDPDDGYLPRESAQVLAMTLRVALSSFYVVPVAEVER